jgi:hypothetical protein
MSKFTNQLAKLKEDMVVLSTTRHIRDEDTKLPEYYELSLDYNDAVEPCDKVLVSIKNAIITQRRVVFAITRANLSTLVTSDRNWKVKAGFDNNAYPQYIATMTNPKLNFVKCIQVGSPRQPAVYEVLSEDILQYLQVDVAQQRKEVLDFVNKSVTKKSTDQVSDQTSDRIADLEGRSKKLVVSKEEVSKVEDTSKKLASNVSILDNVNVSISVQKDSSIKSDVSIINDIQKESASTVQDSSPKVALKGSPQSSEVDYSYLDEDTCSHLVQWELFGTDESVTQFIETVLMYKDYSRRKTQILEGVMTNSNLNDLQMERIIQGLDLRPAAPTPKKVAFRKPGQAQAS